MKRPVFQAIPGYFRVFQDNFERGAIKNAKFKMQTTSAEVARVAPSLQ
jgi:hypothetical protein